MRAILFCAFLLLSGCSDRNTVQVSPSGDYSAWLSISRGADGYRIWVVHIVSGEDRVEHIEFMEDYPANLMAYIGWDDEERLWFYSSDDGRYYYWEKSGSPWKMYSWSTLESSAFSPPRSLNEGRSPDP